MAAVFGVLMGALHSIAAMTGFFARDIPAELHPVVWVLMVLVLIFLALVRGGARWTAMGAGIVGIIWVAWILFELAVYIPPAEAFGPVLGVVFAALFAFFGFRAYLEKPPA